MDIPTPAPVLEPISKIRIKPPRKKVEEPVSEPLDRIDIPSIFPTEKLENIPKEIPQENDKQTPKNQEIVPEIISKIDDEEIKEAVEQIKSIRLTKLPQHETDFAESWYYGLQKELVSEEIKLEYNTYLQVLEELEKGNLELPEDVNAKDIAMDIKVFVLKDFRQHHITPDIKNNLYHRAFYSHCVKRALDNLRQGEFTDERGYTKKRPEIADIIQNRIDEIYFNKLME